MIYCWLQRAERLAIKRLKYPGSGLRVRVSPFCLPIFADVSNFTPNFYPFPRGAGKPWSTRKRQTGTGVLYLLYLQQFMANLNNETCHSLIGFLTPETLGLLKLQVIPRFTGTGTCISVVPANRNRGILTSLFSNIRAVIYIT